MTTNLIALIVPSLFHAFFGSEPSEKKPADRECQYIDNTAPAHTRQAARAKFVCL